MSTFLNFYECYKCQHKWQDVYKCAAGDMCPECGAKSCEPYRSDELIDERGCPYIKEDTQGWGDSNVATKYVYGRIEDALNSKDLDEMSQELSNLYSELAHNYKVDTGKLIGADDAEEFDYSEATNSEK